MRKTKIVCTLGPATDQGDVLEQLIIKGMNVARCNFSHGSYDEHKARIDKVKELREKHHMATAIMLDTKGPEIRLGLFRDHEVMLEAGDKFVLYMKSGHCLRSLSKNCCCLPESSAQSWRSVKLFLHLQN